MMTKYNPETDFPEAYQICKTFNVSEEQLISIRNSMNRELINGLAKETHDRSSIPCLLSYVQQFPSGRERGRFLSLEMWSTNCRIMLVKFGSEKDIYMSSKCLIVPHSIAASRSTVLFNFLAENIASFVREKKVEKDNLPMGIAFNFPLRKLAVDVGILVGWTKGYGAQAAVGKDVVQLLRNALAEQKGIQIDLNNIVNIAVGSLMALAWAEPNCKMGLIVGSGTNAAYVEKIDECQMFEGDDSYPDMIINTDWSNFGSNGHLDFIRNEFDKLVDSESNNPGKQFYEKCISTLYMGELVRLIVARLMSKGAIFKGFNQDYIDIQWKMEMKSIIAIESDPPDVFTAAQEVMNKFRMTNCEEKDLAMLRYICSAVTTRSAKLVAAGVSCLINRINLPHIVISVDGGVYRLFPKYQVTLNRYTMILTNPKNQYEFMINADSPGVGAALLSFIIASGSQVD